MFLGDFALIAPVSSEKCKSLPYPFLKSLPSEELKEILQERVWRKDFYTIGREIALKKGWKNLLETATGYETVAAEDVAKIENILGKR